MVFFDRSKFGEFGKMLHIWFGKDALVTVCLTNTNVKWNAFVTVSSRNMNAVMVSCQAKMATVGL